jgi:hypothetical protein
MRMLAHVEIAGHEMVDGIAKDGAKRELYYLTGVRLSPAD